MSDKFFNFNNKLGRLKMFTQFKITVHYYTKKGKGYCGQEDVIITKETNVSIDTVLEYFYSHPDPKDYTEDKTKKIGFSAPLKQELQYDDTTVNIGYNRLELIRD